jgi:hypothetical protein
METVMEKQELELIADVIKVGTEYHIDLLVLYAALTEQLNKQLEETC